MNKILTYPNKILRKKAEKIETVDEILEKDVKNLVEGLKLAENGAGLAAPQIGISRSFFGLKDENKEVRVILNPMINKTWGEKVYPKMIDDKEKQEDFLEGCLSFPGFWGTVKRWLKIEVEWQELIDKKLVSKSETLEGFRAIVWQHESDHLEGILFVDHVKKDGGKFYKNIKGEMVKWSVNDVLKKGK